MRDLVLTGVRAGLTAVVISSGCGGDAGQRGADAALPDAASPAVLDPTFGDHGLVKIASASCERMTVGLDDKPVVLLADAAGHLTIARYGTDGRLDTTFGDGGKTALGTGAETRPSGLLVSSSAGLLVTALVASGKEEGSTHVFRLGADGKLDAGFGTAGEVVVDALNYTFGAGARSDGGLDLAGVGHSTTNAFALVRLTSTGALDGNFGSGGVAIPDTPGVPSGYFPHAAHLGDGRFAISGASFAPTNEAGGVGPITGHLFLVADAGVVSHVQADHSQFLALVPAGDRFYSLRNLFDVSQGQLDRWGLDLIAEQALAAPVPISFDVYFGPYNGGSLAVAPDGELLVTGQTGSGGENLLDRFHSDGSLATATTLEAVLGSATPGVVCGLAFDSMSRPVVADSRTVARLAH